MNMKKRAVSMILVLVLVLGVGTTSAVAMDKDLTFATLRSTDFYPITGTAEWSTMDRADRVEMCQLSKEAIDTMSTEELLYAVLDYPFMIDIFAFDTYREGFLCVCNEFPALAALTARKDYSDALINAYQEMPVASRSKQKESEMHDDIIKLSTLEILLAQPEAIERAEDAEILRIGKITDEKCSQKIEEGSIYSGSISTFYEAVSESPNSAMRVGSNEVTIYTPKRTPVKVIDNYALTDWSSEEKKALNEAYAEAYPTAVLISDPNKRYNCHSYAWHNNVFSNYYWMNDPGAYMTDGSYNRAFGVRAKYKAYWDTADLAYAHSAIVISTDGGTKYESKWGKLGVYQHGQTDCPYSGTITYWSRA